MDPLVVFDRQRPPPAPLELTLAAAALGWALDGGAGPRLDRLAGNTSDLALQQIAAGVFARKGPTPLPPVRGPVGLLARPKRGRALRGSASAEDAATPRLLLEETVH